MAHYPSTPDGLTPRDMPKGTRLVRSVDSHRPSTDGSADMEQRRNVYTSD